MLPGIILIILCVVSGDVPIFASKEAASSIIAISGILIPFSAVLYSSMLRLIELPWGVLISLIDTQEKSGQTVIRKLRGTLELLAKRTTVDIEETTWSSWLFSTGFLLASVFLAFIGLISPRAEPARGERLLGACLHLHVDRLSEHDDGCV